MPEKKRNKQGRGGGGGAEVEVPFRRIRNYASPEPKGKEETRREFANKFGKPSVRSADEAEAAIFYGEFIFFFTLSHNRILHSCLAMAKKIAPLAFRVLNFFRRRFYRVKL